jgi:hypothetical protein
MTHTYRLHVIANYPDEVEEDYSYKAGYEIDDLLGIVKTYLEYADKAKSFVIVLVREEDTPDAAREREVEERRLREMGQWEEPEFWDREEPEHKVEGTQANFDRYIAGDR